MKKLTSSLLLLQFGMQTLLPCTALSAEQRLSLAMANPEAAQKLQLLTDHIQITVDRLEEGKRLRFFKKIARFAKKVDRYLEKNLVVADAIQTTDIPSELNIPTAASEHVSEVAGPIAQSTDQETRQEARETLAHSMQGLERVIQKLESKRAHLHDRAPADGAAEVQIIATILVVGVLFVPYLIFGGVGLLVVTLVVDVLAIVAVHLVVKFLKQAANA